MEIFSYIYIFVVFVFLIRALGYAFSDTKRKYFIKYSILLASIILFFDLLVILLNLSDLEENLLLLSAIGAFSYLKFYAFGSAGMKKSLETGLPNLPLIRQLFGNGKSYIKNGRRYFLDIAIAILLITLYSFVLFKLTNPNLSGALVYESVEYEGVSFDFSPTINMATLLFVFQVGLGEEIIFRHWIQNYIISKIQGNGKYIIAILLTSLIWTMGHMTVLEPAWIKAAQIFPIGILLGYLHKKHGIESCMIVHGLFNVIMALNSDKLIN